MAEYNESQINSNETERIAAEQERINNEAQRQTKETEREAREATRQSNESIRISKEAERLAEEVNRQEAEASRVTAEQGRVTAEQDREARFNEMEAMVAEVEGELDGKVSKTDLALNVNDFGIYGDGVTDITYRLNSLILELSNYAWEVSDENTFKKVKPVKLYFPRGKYLISDTINLAPYVFLEGEYTSLGNNYKIKEWGTGVVDFAENGTAFICKFADGNKFAFNISAYHSEGLRDTDINRYYDGPNSMLYHRLESVTLKNMQIISDGYLFGGLYCVGSPFVTLDTVNVLGSDIGIYISSVWNGRITNCGFHCKNYGVIGYRDVNNVSFTGCSIEHYYMYGNRGLGDRSYNHDTLPVIYPSESQHMPAEQENLTTGIYLRNCWQMSFNDCTLQNYQRGVFCFQSNVVLDTIWCEMIGVVDVHSTFATVDMVSFRKETSESKLLRATGRSVVTATNLHGSNDRGIWVDSNDDLIDYKDDIAIVNFIGTPTGSTLSGLVVADNIQSNSVNVTSIAFNGHNTINDILKISLTPTTDNVNKEVTIPFPTGFTKYNTVILGVNRHKTNSVIYVDNNAEYYMSNNGIVCVPKSTERLEFTLMRID